MLMKGAPLTSAMVNTLVATPASRCVGFSNCSILYNIIVLFKYVMVYFFVECEKIVVTCIL